MQLKNDNVAATPADITARVSQMLRVCRALVVTNGLFIGILTIYGAIFQIVLGPMTDLPRLDFVPLALHMLGQTLPLLLFTLAVNRAYYIAKYQKPSNPIRVIFRECWQFISNRNRLLLGIPVLTIMVLFKYIFLEFKVNIPRLEPFSWDQAFYELDKVMHFGFDPWQIVHPFFQLNDYFVFVLNINYQYWFLSMWAIFAAYAFSRSVTFDRTRYLLAFFLTWAIGGNLLAIVFSSAGPAFYSGLGLSPDPYTPLFQHLEMVDQHLPLSALELQQLLWSGYTDIDYNYGISAMPSMHNALALLSVIGAWRFGPISAAILSVHAFLIYIGSFYLGWHYAVDAYLGWAVALAMWVLAKPVAQWWHDMPAVISHAESLIRHPSSRSK